MIEGTEMRRRDPHLTSPFLPPGGWVLPSRPWNIQGRQDGDEQAGNALSNQALYLLRTVLYRSVV